MNKTIVAILCIAAIVIVGMVLGTDGYLYGLGIAAISGLGGFAIKLANNKIKKKRGK